MKKTFEYIALVGVTLFSFYYTDRVTKIMNSKDPVMENIKQYQTDTKTACKEGYITSEGVVLGVNGSIVNVSESYSNMQGVGYDPSLMVWDEISCEVTKETSIDNYIIKGNEATNSVSLFINVIDASLLKEITEISDTKNVKLNLILTGSILETNKDLIKELSTKGYNLIYGGIEENDFKKYLKILKDFNQKDNTYCINLGLKDTLDMCKKKNINSIKTNNIYTNSILLNTKKNLEKGGFYVYKENKNTLEELSATINFIKGKQLKIVSLEEILN